VIFTLFTNRYGLDCHEQDATPGELAKFIETTGCDAREDLPLVKFACFGDVPTAMGCLRNDDNVLGITGIEADYDAGKVSLGEAVEVARDAGLHCIIYSSPSSTAARPRWRILCPLSGVYRPEDRDLFMGRLAGAYARHGVTFDPASWTLSQSYFIGGVNGSVPTVEIISGGYLDQLDALDDVAIERPKSNGAGKGGGSFDGRALIAAILSGASYHRASLSLLGHWASIGIGMIEAEARLRGLFEAAPNHDQRWQDRVAEIPRILCYVYGKLADENDQRVEFTIGGGDPDEINLQTRLSMENWMEREIPLRDQLLGNVLSSTTRMLLIADTGLGKTNFALAISFAVAQGVGFLHWQGTGEPRRVLYIDGEMSVRLMRDRLEDAVRRSGVQPRGMFVLNTEDFPEIPPLSEPLGRLAIDRVIEILGGIDLVIFDNVQALISGDMKEELPWRGVLGWVKDLTRRKVAQVWVHHTGHDATRSYGTKTREWQMDVVALLEAVERPEADLAFQLTFTKARERTPGNRSDFDPVVVTLTDDRWVSEPGDVPGRKRPHRDRALELLRDAITREGEVPPADPHIPAGTLCVTLGLWRRYCKAGFVVESESDPEGAFRVAFHRSCKKLLDTGRVGKHDLWVWVIP
jgi:hypothetical protein